MTVYQNPSPAPRPPAPRSTRAWFWRAYLTAWMVLAAGALGYLVLITNDPRLGERLATLTGSPSAPPEKAVATAKEVEDFRRMRAAIARLSARVTEVQDTVERQRRTVAEVSGKVAATERPATPPAESYPQSDNGAGAEPPPQAAEPPSREPILVKTRTVTVRRRDKNLPPLPTRVVRRALPRTTASITPPSVGSANARSPSRSPSRQPTILNDTGPAQEPPRQPETRAQPKPPPAPRQPSSWQTSPATASFPQADIGPPPAAPQAAVTLSIATSLDGLRASWDQLIATHPALLAGLQPRYSRAANGMYRLLAGPLDDRVSADRLCNALRTSNVACGVSSYAGNAL